MAQDLGQLTDMWMVNPNLFDPTQASNQFSLYNSKRIPFPPTYNTGAGGPVNAATGQPIQSFQQWQQANPGGVSLNSTPAQPPAQANTGWNQNPVGSPLNPAGDWSQLAPALPGASAQQQANYAHNLGLGGFIDPNTRQAYIGGGQGAGGNAVNGVGTTGAQPSPPPNNWNAAINALSNPGKPQMPGATVPLQTGYQPSGGVNAAYLQNAGQGQGMNQGFLSALRAIQNR